MLADWRRLRHTKKTNPIAPKKPTTAKKIRDTFPPMRFSTISLAVDDSPVSRGGGIEEVPVASAVETRVDVISLSVFGCSGSGTMVIGGAISVGEASPKIVKYQFKKWIGLGLLSLVNTLIVQSPTGSSSLKIKSHKTNEQKT